MNNSVPNAIGTTLKTTVQKNAGITFTAVNNTINIDFSGLATKSYSILVGGPYSLAAISNILMMVYHILRSIIQLQTQHSHFLVQCYHSCVLIQVLLIIIFLKV